MVRERSEPDQHSVVFEGRNPVAIVSVASGGTAERIAARIWFKVLRAGSGAPARYSSISFGALLTSAGFALHHGALAPGAGPPLHVHSREDETFYILAGEVEVTIGDQRDALRAGDCVFLRRGIPHRLQNLGPETAQVLLLIHPPGLERFFEEIAQLSTPPSVAAIRSISARYGITPVG